MVGKSGASGVSRAIASQSRQIRVPGALTFLPAASTPYDKAKFKRARAQL
jgi:hypothetical protein